MRWNLRPWLVCIEQALSALLPRGQFAQFNADALMRGATQERYAAYKSAREASWMSVNEIRALEDMEPMDGGDEYIQPLNYGPLGSDPTGGSNEAGTTPQA